MDQTIVTVKEDQVEIIEVGSVSASARPTTGAFVLDVTNTSVVGAKVYETSALVSCSVDTAAVRVWVGCEGDASAYTPTMTVNGVAATLTESATKRWFTGYADIVLPETGPNTVTARASTGSSGVATITKLAGGPEIQNVTFGAYPGTQTALKNGDVISVTITADSSATEVFVTGGSVVSGGPFAVTAGVATGTVTIGVATGSQTFTVAARNSFGTFGGTFTTPALNLSQTYPSFGAMTVTYPNGQGALGTDEAASVVCTVTNADEVTYTATGLSVPAGYAATKIVTNTSAGYVATGVNYTITAVNSANNATASFSGLVKIATTVPTAYITSPVRLVSSPSGQDSEIRIYPTQALLSAPSLDAQLGVWQGSWVNNGSYWSRMLRISDAYAKGAATFSNLSLTGLSGIAGSTITSGASYILGGMSSRTLTFAAFARVTALGCAVGDQTKTSASIVGGNTLSRYSNANVVANGYYIANADGSYNANGAYLGLSDSSLAGANTSGTLQATFAEAA